MGPESHAPVRRACCELRGQEGIYTECLTLRCALIAF